MIVNEAVRSMTNNWG